MRPLDDCRFGAKFSLMARLHVMNLEGRRDEVTLSRRNLLTSLQKLDWRARCGRSRETTASKTASRRRSIRMSWRRATAADDARAALRGRRRALREAPAGPGLLHPATGRFVQEHGGVAGEALSAAPKVEPGGESEEA